MTFVYYGLSRHSLFFVLCNSIYLFYFFFNDTATTEIYTLSLHDALPIFALRDKVGPFGTLLVTGVDWSGPNAAWGRESMRLLADVVMPLVRRHPSARAAE